MTTCAVYVPMWIGIRERGRIVEVVAELFASSGDPSSSADLDEGCAAFTR